MFIIVTMNITTIVMFTIISIINIIIAVRKLQALAAAGYCRYRKENELAMLNVMAHLNALRDVSKSSQHWMCLCWTHHWQAIIGSILILRFAQDVDRDTKLD